MEIEWNRFFWGNCYFANLPSVSLSLSLCLFFYFSSIYLFFSFFLFVFLMDAAAPCHDPTKMLYGARILACDSYIIDSNIKFDRIFSLAIKMTGFAPEKYSL